MTSLKNRVEERRQEDDRLYEKHRKPLEDGNKFYTVDNAESSIDDSWLRPNKAE